ncbi:hypothetical protein JI742_07605 [Piscinibacter sp. Jin2]|uniref:Uncharacterized protein n=1 Tax=Aquariibacter lacus TaxID=2801332 RepID=A0A9X0XF70_9BURK|nr:hypothetical protein [Piscinibacter lacus]MBL0719752.1 hypothetical protein [Piscinibacter lacus]
MSELSRHYQLDALASECTAIGRESAAAGLRLDRKLPETYRAAYEAYDGPKKRLGYYEGKWLSLRLSAVRRGMIVDATVTPALLERMTDGRCPVTLEPFRMGGGPSPRNPSVDRLVNEVSYRAGNLCMLSQRANRAKAELSFEEVAQIAQAGDAYGELASIEWMRLASLMYGAWARAYKLSDPYLLPLAAIPGAGMFMSTSQVVQLLLTRHYGPAGSSPSATGRWTEMTRDAGCDVAKFTTLSTRLAAALAKEPNAGNAWLHGDVFDAFVAWYQCCRHVVAPSVELLLERRQLSAGDPVADLAWPTTSRYKH